MTGPIKIIDTIKCIGNSKTTPNSCLYSCILNIGKTRQHKKIENHPLKSSCSYAIKRGVAIFNREFFTYA